MKNLRHPNFILAISSGIVLIIGIGLRANAYPFGDYVIIASAVMGVVHYIWSITDVISRHDLKPFQKRFWLIAVVACPLIGGMLFYVLHQRGGRITT